MIANIDTAAYPENIIVPFMEIVHDRINIEVLRGCTRGCRFCHAGMVYRPVRERSLDTITGLLDDCLKKTGFDEISFLSLSTGDFSALKTLSHGVLGRCAQEQISLSLPSLRVGSIDDEIMQRMSDLRRTGCTLAPEAGSQRLRDVINKNLTEDEILTTCANAFSGGWNNVKLYFMLGLPTETDEDVLGIADLAARVMHAWRESAANKQRGVRITVSTSWFVPKPHTPFQFVPMDTEESLQAKQMHLLEKRFGVKARDGYLA